MKTLPISSIALIRLLASTFLLLMTSASMAQNADTTSEEQVPIITDTLSIRIDTFLTIDTSLVSSETLLTAPSDTSSATTSKAPVPSPLMKLISGILLGWLGITIGYIVVCFFLFRFRPLSLAEIHRWLSEEENIISKIPFYSYISSKFVGHPRTLDAWVAANSSFFVSNYQRDYIVRERRHHIFMPLQIIADEEEKQVGAQDLTYLRDKINLLFSERRGVIEINGIGGSGKTSLACQVANWMLHHDSNSGSPIPIMLPLFYRRGSNTDLSEWAEEQIKIITGSSKISTTLINNLVQKKRILVIADGLSEVTNDEKKAITQPNMVVGAMLITTRQEETNITWGRKVQIHLEPIDTSKNRIYFLTQYFGKKGVREFGDEEYQIMIQRLSRISDHRVITPAMIKLFAEEAINLHQSEGKQGLRRLPLTFPNLLRQYVLGLLQQSHSTDKLQLSEDDLLEGVQEIAIASMDSKWIPGGADKNVLTTSLASSSYWTEESIRTLLDTLKRSNLLYRSVINVQLWIDPATEYFAAMRILERNGRRIEKWNDFLSQFKTEAGIVTDGPLGFLSALYDVVYSADSELSPPTEVVERIGQLLGMGQPEDRIVMDQIIRDVFDSNVHIRQRAPFKLMEYGELGKSSIQDIISIAHNRDSTEAWSYALGCIGQLGHFASDYAVDLVRLLQHSDVSLRLMTIQTLGYIDSTGQTISYLCNALMDPEPRIRAASIIAIDRIGPLTEDIPEALESELQERVPFIHWHAAQALRHIAGPQKVIDSLCISVKDPNSFVRAQAAKTLGRITRKWLVAVIKGLADQDFDVRQKSVEMICQTLPPSVATLNNALYAEGKRIRRLARHEIEKILPILRDLADSLKALMTDHESDDLRSQTVVALKMVSTTLTSINLDDVKKHSARLRARMLSQHFRTIRLTVSALVVAASDPDPAIRKRAIHSLENITPLIVKMLEDATKDSNSSVRRLSVRALSELQNEIPPSPS